MSKREKKLSTQAAKLLKEFPGIPLDKVGEADVEIKARILAYQNEKTNEDVATLIRSVVTDYIKCTNSKKLVKKSNKLAGFYLENNRIWNFQENWFCLLAYIISIITMICRVLELETLVNDITLFCIYLIALFVWIRITNNKKLMGKEIEKYFIAFNNHAPSWTIISSMVFYLAVISDVPKGVLIAIIIASVVLGGSLSWTWYQRLKKVGNSSKV